MPDFPFSPRPSWMPQRSATRRVTPSDMWVLRLSQTTCQRAAGGAEANRLSSNDTKSRFRPSSRVTSGILRALKVMRESVGGGDRRQGRGGESGEAHQSERAGEHVPVRRREVCVGTRGEL